MKKTYAKEYFNKITNKKNKFKKEYLVIYYIDNYGESYLFKDGSILKKDDKNREFLHIEPLKEIGIDLKTVQDPESHGFFNIILITEKKELQKSKKPYLKETRILTEGYSIVKDRDENGFPVYFRLSQEDTREFVASLGYRTLEFEIILNQSDALLFIHELKKKHTYMQGIIGFDESDIPKNKKNKKNKPS